MLVGLIQVIFTGVAALIMDKAGRKILLIISGMLSQPQAFIITPSLFEVDTVILFLTKVLP